MHDNLKCSYECKVVFHLTSKKQVYKQGKPKHQLSSRLKPVANNHEVLGNPIVSYLRWYVMEKIKVVGMKFLRLFWCEKLIDPSFVKDDEILIIFICARNESWVIVIKLNFHLVFFKLHNFPSKVKLSILDDSSRLFLCRYDPHLHKSWVNIRNI